jgi:hypothetical protein
MAHLWKYFPDWNLSMAGYEEEYTKDGFTLSFLSPRCYDGIANSEPIMYYIVTHEGNIILKDFAYFNEFRAHRDKTMSHIQKEVKKAMNKIQN